MDQRSKIGVAAASLAVAATLLPAGVARADDQVTDQVDVCKDLCPGPGDVYFKLGEIFLKLEELSPAPVDFRGIYNKLGDVFIKFG